MPPANIRQLAELIKQETDKGIAKIYEKTFLRGVVMSVTDRKIGVRIEGNTTTLPNVLCMGQYSPVVGDKVFLVSIGETGTNFLCLGRIDITASKFVDANGWMVYDNGAWKEWRYSFAYNVTTAFGARSTIGSSIPTPYGKTMADIAIVPALFGNYSGHSVVGFEGTATVLSVQVGNEYSGGSLNFIGTCHLIAREL